MWQAASLAADGACGKAQSAVADCCSLTTAPVPNSAVSQGSGKWPGAATSPIDLQDTGQARLISATATLARKGSTSANTHDE